MLDPIVCTLPDMRYKIAALVSSVIDSVTCSSTCIKFTYAQVTSRFESKTTELNGIMFEFE